MPVILSSIEYGGYFSLVKLLTFMVLCFGWLPVIAWIYTDSQAVKGRTVYWLSIVFGTYAIASIVWLMMPLFLVGILLYLIAVCTTAMVYIVHRNSRVPEYERVLTAGHVKSIFSNEEKQATQANKGLVFLTANDNEAPVPEAKSPEFFAYKMSQEFFDDAIWRRASDVVFKPGRDEYDVHYVIDGVAVKQQGRTREDMEYFGRYLKQLGDLDVNEKRKPQKSVFTVSKDGQKTAWQIMTSGSTIGEHLHLKLREEHSLIKLEELGLMDDQLKQLEELKSAEPGLFIVSGPAKSGVTTTFYAMIRAHDPFLNNINTLEKSTLAELPNVTQNTYSLSDSSTTGFARRLQTVLRTGPDIVGVGDCDDAETAAIAIEAAKNGQRIYITINAPSVVKALAKWIKLVGDRSRAIDLLRGLSNQRLIRKLCSNCKEAYEPNKELLKKFNLPADKIKHFHRPGQIQYDKRGTPLLCDNCQGTGFFERTGVFETLILTDELREAIKGSKDLNEISTHLRRARMLYLQEQALRKVAVGETSVNEIIREFSTAKKPRKATKPK